MYQHTQWTSCTQHVHNECLLDRKITVWINYITNCKSLNFVFIKINKTFIYLKRCQVMWMLQTRISPRIWKQGVNTGIWKQGVNTGIWKQGVNTGIWKQGVNTGIWKQGVNTGIWKQGVNTGIWKKGVYTGIWKQGVNTEDLWNLEGQKSVTQFTRIIIPTLYIDITRKNLLLRIC